MLKFIEGLKIFGNIAAIFNFCILMGLVVTVYILTHTDDAELFPSPIVYLDAQYSSRDNAFYPPVNGENLCLGDEVLWEKNATFNRSTRIQRSYYLLIERPYSFTGPQADKLAARYGEEAQTTRTLHSTVMSSTHVSEGFFDGGLQSFTLPTAEQLRPHKGIKPGNQLRLYVDVEAPFSQANGYYVPITIGPDCPEVKATVQPGRGERTQSFLVWQE